MKKIIKFRKEDQNKYPFQHYIGVVNQSYQKPKKPTKPITISPKPNVKKIIRPIDNKSIHKYEDIIEPEVNQRFSNSKEDSDYALSDNDDFMMSSVKKKQEKVKLVMPKGFDTTDVIETLKRPFINHMKRVEPILKVEDIFSLDIMQAIMGIGPEQLRKVQKKTSGLTQNATTHEKPVQKKEKLVSIINQPDDIYADKNEGMDLEIIEQNTSSKYSHPDFTFMKPNFIQNDTRFQMTQHQSSQGISQSYGSYFEQFSDSDSQPQQPEKINNFYDQRADTYGFTRGNYFSERIDTQGPQYGFGTNQYYEELPQEMKNEFTSQNFFSERKSTYHYNFAEDSSTNGFYTGHQPYYISGSEREYLMHNNHQIEENMGRRVIKNMKGQNRR